MKNYMRCDTVCPSTCHRIGQVHPQVYIWVFVKVECVAMSSSLLAPSCGGLLVMWELRAVDVLAGCGASHYWFTHLLGDSAWCCDLQAGPAGGCAGQRRRAGACGAAPRRAASRFSQRPRDRLGDRRRRAACRGRTACG